MAFEGKAHAGSLVAGNNAIWESKKYSDLTVQCGPEEFKLHRAIVCPRSTFFEKACDGPFLEGETGVIVLDDDPPTVRRMLIYLYTLEYEDTGKMASIVPYSTDMTSSQETKTNEDLPADKSQLFVKLLNNIAVYAVADKYDIPSLKVLARSKVDVLISGHSLTSDLPTLIDAIFSTTPDTDGGLRQVAIKFCKERIAEMEGSAGSSDVFAHSNSVIGGVVYFVVVFCALYLLRSWVLAARAAQLMELQYLEARLRG